MTGMFQRSAWIANASRHRMVVTSRRCKGRPRTSSEHAESDSLLHDLLRLFVVLTDADHYRSPGEVFLEMPGGPEGQQVPRRRPRTEAGSPGFGRGPPMRGRLRPSSNPCPRIKALICGWDEAVQLEEKAHASCVCTHGRSFALHRALNRSPGAHGPAASQNVGLASQERLNFFKKKFFFFFFLYI